MSALTKALIAARTMVQSTVYKAGRNQAQNYAFVGHEHVLTHVRTAMLNHGLTLEQTRVEFVSELTYKTRNGEQTAWLWRGDHLLTHEGGEARAYSFLATTGPNDKAGFVASTALDRTALLRVMQLAGSNEENPEHDTNEQQDVPPTPRVDRIAELVDVRLSECSSRADLVAWARTLAKAKGEKKEAWTAFGAMCKALECDPAAVAAEARGA